MVGRSCKGPCWRNGYPDHPRGPSGTRVFAALERGGWFEYTVRGGMRRTARAPICVSCRNYRGRWRRHGRQALVHVRADNGSLICSRQRIAQLLTA